MNVNDIGVIMYVYRLEYLDSETNEYRGIFSHKAVDTLTNRMSFLPVPQCETELAMHFKCGIHFCAVNSIQGLKYWFDTRELYAYNDIYVTCLEVKDFVSSETQTIYKEQDVKRVVYRHKFCNMFDDIPTPKSREEQFAELIAMVTR